jgi:acyl dehydratase
LRAIFSLTFLDDGANVGAAREEAMFGSGPAAKIKEYLGRQIVLSDWLTIGQERINAFAECTEDRQWIHVDEGRARKGPLGGTVAHGFLLLSLLPYFNMKSEIAGLEFKSIFNYGLNRVRFITPVRAGARVRNRAVLKSIEKKGFRRLLAAIENTIEVEGEKKPALIAEILVYCVL